MKTRFPISRWAAPAALVLAAAAFFPQKSQAQCYDGGGGHSGGFHFFFFSEPRGHFHDDFYFDRDRSFYDDRFDFYEGPRYRRSPETFRRVIPRLPDSRRQALRRQFVQPEVNPPARNTAPQPRQNDSSKGTFDLELPDPAPRDNDRIGRRNEAPKNPVTNQPPVPQERIPAPSTPPRPVEKTGGFPLDAKILDTAGNDTTVRAAMGNNRAMLIDFWAEWCGPCIQGMPNLKREAEELAEFGIAVAGMNVDGDAAAAKRVSKRFGMENLPWLLEPKSQPFSDKYDIRSIPQVILVTADGEVLFQGHPSKPELGEALESLKKSAPEKKKKKTLATYWGG